MTAFELLGELVEFDRTRYLLQTTRAGTPGLPNNIDVFIDDGSACYSSLLAVLHGEARIYPLRETSKWLKFARKTRKHLAKETGLMRDDRGPLIPREEDAQYVNRADPARSFTGNAELQAKAGAVAGEVAAAESAEDELAEDEEFECPECEARFSDMNDYAEHYADAH